MRPWMSDSLRFKQTKQSCAQTKIPRFPTILLLRLLPIVLLLWKANRAGNHRIWGARPLPSIRQTVMIFQGDVDNQTAENIASPRTVQSLMVRPRFSSMTGPASLPPTACLFAAFFVVHLPNANAPKIEAR